jgi:hypothetical protein
MYRLAQHVPRLVQRLITKQDMIRPLTYRHPAFEGWTKGNSDQIVNFIKSIDRKGYEYAPKSKWIQSFWLRWDLQAAAQDAANCVSNHPLVLADMLMSLVPRMVHLREFFCRMVLSVSQFTAIVDCHATTLRRLATSFKDLDMPRIAPLFNRFTALEDLQILIHQSVSRSWPRQGLALPNLRLLEIQGTEQSINSVLNWLMHSSLTKLRTVRLQCLDDGLLDLDTLSSFLAKHGGTLNTFGYDGTLSSLTTAVFPHTPRLRHLELERPFKSPSNLQGLPISVVEVTFAIVGNRIEYYGSHLHGILAALKGLPHGSNLSTFRAVTSRPYLKNCNFSFKKCLAGKQTTGVMMKKFIERAERLKGLGIKLLDEEGLDLMNVIATMDHTE